MQLQARLNELANEMGADFFGAADLAPARDAIIEQGGTFVGSFPRALSVGVGLFSAIVDQLPNRADRAVAMTYRQHCYDLINTRLDLITSRLSSELERNGHQALPVPASQTVNDERLLSIFSNKMAAHLAGLGWIGKSCLLVTPEVGPRVRWATVLTDAPLETGRPMANGCGECSACVDICPPQAFTGRAFHADEPRESRFDAHKCSHYFDEMIAEGGPPVCGMCLYVCPHGR